MWKLEKDVDSAMLNAPFGGGKKRYISTGRTIFCLMKVSSSFYSLCSLKYYTVRNVTVVVNLHYNNMIKQG